MVVFILYLDYAVSLSRRNFLDTHQRPDLAQ